MNLHWMSALLASVRLALWHLLEFVLNVRTSNHPLKERITPPNQYGRNSRTLISSSSGVHPKVDHDIGFTMHIRLVHGNTLFHAEPSEV